MQNSFTNKTIEKLKYDLVREGLISYEKLSEAEETAKNKNIHLGQAIVQLNLVPEEALLGFVEAKLHIPYVNLNDYTLDKKCLKYVSAQEARNYRIIPLFRIEDVLTIAMADPLDLFLLNNLINGINCKIEPIICSETSILEAIEKHYSRDKTVSTPIKPEKAQIDWREELNNENHDDLQAKKIIQAILHQAIAEEVQEIFFENSQSGMAVKFRKNRKILNKGTIPVLLIPLCISSLKIMAGLDPAVSQTPQLGKIILTEKINLSISTFPTVKGERIVLRIFNPPEQLENLGLNGEEIDFIKDCLNKSGVIIVAGSDLQDKSSVIYSLLSEINREDKNIMTVESIVKYEIQGINQCELAEKVGFNIDKVRKFLEFQSPDVVYLEDALSCADLITSLVQSGKLVLTELHDNEKIWDKLEKFFNKELINCVIFIENSRKIKLIRR